MALNTDLRNYKVKNCNSIKAKISYGKTLLKQNKGK